MKGQLWTLTYFPCFSSPLLFLCLHFSGKRKMPRAPSSTLPSPRYIKSRYLHIYNPSLDDGFVEIIWVSVWREQWRWWEFQIRVSAAAVALPGSVSASCPGTSSPPPDSDSSAWSSRCCRTGTQSSWGDIDSNQLEKLEAALAAWLVCLSLLSLTGSFLVLLGKFLLIFLHIT